MYKSFAAKNFRCFHDLAISNLERVNLIAGVNNVGKTALLEALFLHCGAYNPELSLRLNAFRGIEVVKVEIGRWGETPWDTLFRDFDTSQKVELVGDDEVMGRRMLRLRLIRDPKELAKIGLFVQHRSNDGALLSSKTAQVIELEYQEEGQEGRYYMILSPEEKSQYKPFPPPPPFPAFFQGARMRIPPKDEAEGFGNLENRGEQDMLLGILQIIEPRLRRAFVRVVAGEPIIHGDIGLARSMPLSLMGEGMTRLSSLVLHIGNAPHGVVLIDEIENGLHYSILPKVWRAIVEAARRFNTQVFATTHSLECIATAHKALTEGGRYDFRLHRLERTKDEIRAVTYDQEALAAALETGLEVR